MEWFWLAQRRSVWMILFRRHTAALTPGVELQARVLTSILDAEVPYEPAGRSYSWRLFAYSLVVFCTSVPQGAGELRSSVCRF